MTTEKLKSVLQFYADWLFDRYVEPLESPDDPSGLPHLRWMVGRCLDDFIPSGRPESVNRAFVWLGYVQGCLFCHGHFTLAELRDHNRPFYSPESGKETS